MLIMIIFIISVFSKVKHEGNAHLIEQSKILDDEINEKTKQLSEVNNQLETQTVDRSTFLTAGQTKVLDIYEQSNIKLPVEIIEELTHLRITNENDIFKFIENQRYYWKLENTKKPFRMDVKK